MGGAGRLSDPALNRGQRETIEASRQGGPSVMMGRLCLDRKPFTDEQVPPDGTTAAEPAIAS